MYAVILNLETKGHVVKNSDKHSAEISIMATSLPFQYRLKLSENDVPGAMFVYECIDKHSNTQLRRWLECRGLQKSGIRSQILKW